jgi:hypothetical protein
MIKIQVARNETKADVTSSMIDAFKRQVLCSDSTSWPALVDDVARQMKRTWPGYSSLAANV